ncbi:hypothetical protein SSX86_000200 [Deinandra increscens subsp. villosa]|uniref:BPL/LPL catalytic domain-containing protein n=1 Tax=Deinandra increscens subsp. villosa TaxID=3103831 RepID=A0AAP0HDB2_9ASTR
MSPPFTSSSEPPCRSSITSIFKPSWHSSTTHASKDEVGWGGFNQIYLVFRYPPRSVKLHTLLHIKKPLKMARRQVGHAGLPLMNIVRMKGVPILQQLEIEECLLRTSSDNWCIINDGADKPSIVMGVSGKPAGLVEIRPVLEDKIPVIRRFTGGGTVIVDHGTIFVSFICNKNDVADVQPYPRPIMSWSGLLYSQVFQGIADFRLRENDYVIGLRKFGGNAQSITKNRWIHHTSFLWDYETRNMSYLKIPERAPDYRLGRDHLDFICPMKDYLSRSDFISKTIDATRSHFSVKSTEFETVRLPSNPKFTPTSRLLTNQELEPAGKTSI